MVGRVRSLALSSRTTTGPQNLPSHTPNVAWLTDLRKRCAFVASAFVSRRQSYLMAGYRNSLLFFARHLRCKARGCKVANFRLARQARSIFVNRERRQDVHATIRCVADSLAAGEVVGIFPEGTSTDGRDVSPFRSALIGAVSETLRREQHLSAIFIQPVSVAYVGANQRSAIWALEDEIPFVLHLLQVISLRRSDRVGRSDFGRRALRP
jgi:hypothetical protein